MAHPTGITIANPTTRVAIATTTLRRGTIAKNSLRDRIRTTNSTMEAASVAASITRVSGSWKSRTTETIMPLDKMMIMNHQADRLRLPSADPKITSTAAHAMLGGAGTSNTSITSRTELRPRARAGKTAVTALNTATPSSSARRMFGT